MNQVVFQHLRVPSKLILNMAIACGKTRQTGKAGDGRRQRRNCGVRVVPLQGFENLQHTESLKLRQDFIVKPGKKRGGGGGGGKVGELIYSEGKSGKSR